MELRTDESPLGKFRQGEIVVVEKRSDQAFTGIYATRKIRTQILLRARPLPAPDSSDRRTRQAGCNGNACHAGGLCDGPKEILRS